MINSVTLHKDRCPLMSDTAKRDYDNSIIKEIDNKYENNTNNLLNELSEIQNEVFFY